MSTKHTPGPWTNHGRIAQPGLPHSAVAAKTLLARVYSEAFGDSEQETANANLIAAAPELLDALENVVKHLVVAQWNMRDAAQRDPRWEGCADMCNASVEAAHAAIAKARGAR